MARPNRNDQEETSDPRITERTERNAATSFRDNAEGPPKENTPQQDRPNDLGSFEAPHPLGGNSTMASRRAARLGGDDDTGDDEKQVGKDQTENRSVGRSSTSRK